MLPRLEPRREIARGLIWVTPVIAVALTVATGFVLFTLMGHDPFAALYHFFVSPVLSTYGVAELAVKATPLVLIGIGLAIGFRAERVEHRRRGPAHHRRHRRRWPRTLGMAAGGRLGAAGNVLGRRFWAAWRMPRSRHSSRPASRSTRS